MGHIHTFESFLNEAANESTLEISGNAYAMWNDKKVQRELQDIKIKIVGDMKGVMTLSGDKEELNKVRAILGIKESVINEDFPGPGETVLAKDITPAVLDYFNRTNKKLLIDTKTKKGITGEVGRMYNDLVFNGDTIQLKDIIQVKILESTNESFLNEEQSYDKYFDYYIAKTDATVKDPKGKKITIPSGTVIYARGLGRLVSVDGKILVGLEVLTGNPDFEVVNNSIWPDTIDLTDEIEAWGRSTNDLIQKDPKNIQKIIDNRLKVIASIKKMLK